jgi:transcriptional regulator with XRE-family HTH domain
MYFAAVSTRTRADLGAERQRRLRHDPVALRRKRELRGLEQVELATYVGCSQPHVSDMERGLRSPSVKLLHKLAEALDCPVEELMPGV